jgi:hypothetical protein
MSEAWKERRSKRAAAPMIQVPMPARGSNVDRMVKCPDCGADIRVNVESYYERCSNCGAGISLKYECNDTIEFTPPQNKFDLPPGLFSLVCERADDPSNTRQVYDALLNEIQIKLDSAYKEPQDAAFLMIAQYALILNDIKLKVAVDEGLICRACQTPLLVLSDHNICNDARCACWGKEVKRVVT